MLIDKRDSSKLKYRLKRKWELRSKLRQTVDLKGVDAVDMYLKELALSEYQRKFNKYNPSIDCVLAGASLFNSKVQFLSDRLVGVGPTLARNILIEIPDFENLSIYKVLKMLRLDCFKGKPYKGTKFKYLKTLLYNCAEVAAVLSSEDNSIARLYGHLRAIGLSRKERMFHCVVALVKQMHRALIGRMIDTSSNDALYIQRLWRDASNDAC